jgi:hypothetical protein
MLYVQRKQGFSLAGSLNPAASHRTGFLNLLKSHFSVHLCIEEAAAFPGKPTGHSLNQVCPGPMESPGPSSRPHRKVVESGYILLRKQWTVKKESNRTE